jgi:hypothetical protein
VNAGVVDLRPDLTSQSVNCIADMGWRRDINFTLAFGSGRRGVLSIAHAAVQARTERDADDVSNLCSFRSASAARSPMMMQGAMVLPVVTRGMIEPSAMRRFSIP